MGVCFSCTSKSEIENKLHEAWEDSEISKLSCFNYFQKIIDFSKVKDYTLITTQEGFYDQIFASKEHSKFFELLKQDLIYLITNKQIQFHILIAFIFLTRSIDAIDLRRNIEEILKVTCKDFGFVSPLDKNSEFFRLVIYVYVRIVSKLSFENACRCFPTDHSNENVEREILLKNAFEEKNIDLLLSQLFNEKEFSIENFINKNYEKLKANFIRDELVTIYLKNISHKNNILTPKNELQNSKTPAESKKEIHTKEAKASKQE